MCNVDPGQHPHDTTGNPVILTEAKTLARAADEILEISSSGKPLSKNGVLNAMARAICGPDRNWGFLKSRTGTVKDPRVIAQTTRPAPTTRARPLRVKDLAPEDKQEIPLNPFEPFSPEDGYLPKARLTPREDGGIDVRVFTWGGDFLPNPMARVVEVSASFEPEQVEDIRQNWPNASSLLKDMGWGSWIGGSMMTLTEKYDRLVLILPLGCGEAVIDHEALFTLAQDMKTV